MPPVPEPLHHSHLSCLLYTSMAMLTQCYSIRGLNVVASLNISNTINNVFNIMFIALGDSVSIIVGQLQMCIRDRSKQ